MEILRKTFLIRHKIREIDLNIGDCPLNHHEEETIDNLFKNYNLTKSLSWNKVVNFPHPNNSAIPF